MSTFLKKVMLFLIVFPVFFTLVVFVLTNTSGSMLYEGKTFTNLPLNLQHGAGHTYERFSEIWEYKDLDILFVGSSHCYRTFDTRYYSACGLNTFNMGTTAQSPLNTNFILPGYLDHLKPDLMILEIYSEVLRLEGMESYLDLLTNHPLDSNIFQMAMATRNIKAINAILAKVLDIKRPSISELLSDSTRTFNQYIKGGFVQTRGYSDGKDFKPLKNEPSPRQFEYLRKNIRQAKQRGIKVIMISQPLPVSTLEAIADYDDIHHALLSLSQEEGIEYFDFNYLFDFRDEKWFYDYHHFNEKGVEQFNREFLEFLAAKNYLKTPCYP